MQSGRSLQDIINHMDPEIHMNMKTAVETGRWANGDRLTAEQLENCLQAIIAYEQHNLPEHERVGYIDRTGLKKTHCDDTPADPDAAQTIKWMDEQ